MPRSWRALCAIGLVATLAGCGADGTSPPSEPTAPTPQPAADHLDVAYTTVPRRIALDLYTPAGTPPFPVVVWVHGGSWVSGDRALFPGHPALRLRDRGYAVATIDYRLVPEGFFPAQSHDCKAAVRWLRGNADRYGLDRSRVAAWGASAGGHLAALLGTSGGAVPRQFLAVVICWLTVTFTSFGLYAPRNATVIVGLFVAAMSVAAAVFLILELDGPFDGLIRISSAPLQYTLTQLGL